MIGSVSAGLLGLLTLSIPVGIVLFLLGFGMDTFFSSFPLSRGLGNMVWSSSNSATLIAIPFFVLLGEILVRSGVATRTYAALDRWVSWLPGGLVHANIATATMFSATSGSSVATAATVATVAMPQAEKLGYDPKLFSGAIAAGGTLGIMIPPSINLIVYGFLTQSSIPQLFLAGLIPGLALALMFMAITVLICLIRPELGGLRRTFPIRADAAGADRPDPDHHPVRADRRLDLSRLGHADRGRRRGRGGCPSDRAGLWRRVGVDADRKPYWGRSRSRR